MIEPTENNPDGISIPDSNQVEQAQSFIQLPPPTLYQSMIDNGLSRIRGEIDAIQTLNTALLFEYSRLYQQKEQLELELRKYTANANHPESVTIRKKPAKQRPKRNPTDLHFKTQAPANDKQKQTVNRARACFNLDAVVKQEPLTQLLPSNISGKQYETQQTSLKQTSIVDYMHTR